MDISTNDTLIPENSGTLLIDESTSRFSGAVWYDAIKTYSISLLGCGGINSWAALLLSRLKVARLFIYDPDTVETANMSGQLFRSTDIRRFKVNAISDTIGEYSNYYSIYAYTFAFTGTSDIQDIVICGFDNMIARETAFNAWLRHMEGYCVEDKSKCLFIDGRLSADEFQVFAIQGNDSRVIEEYKNNWLFTDSQAEATVCSFKQTTYMATMIASVMVNIFVNFVANLVDEVPREVPFFTRYSSDNMFFKLEM